MKGPVFIQSGGCLWSKGHLRYIGVLLFYSMEAQSNLYSAIRNIQGGLLLMVTIIRRFPQGKLSWDYPKYTGIAVDANFLHIASLGCSEGGGSVSNRACSGYSRLCSKYIRAHFSSFFTRTSRRLETVRYIL